MTRTTLQPTALVNDWDTAYRRRQDALRRQLDPIGIDALIVTRDCDIRYFTGFCGHDSLLVIRGGGAACISDSRYDEALDSLRDSGVAEVVIGVRHRLHESLPALLQRHRLRRIGIQADHLPVARKAVFESHLRGAQLVDTEGLVGSLRMRKDALEIDAIARAISVNEAALEAALPQMFEGMTERDLGALIEYEMKKRGATAPSFLPIIATGAHGSLPHYETGDAEIENNSTLLVDWGATVNSYQSDLTRTFGIGSIPARIREVYRIVLDAQLAAIHAIRPGKVCAEIDAVAREVITRAGYGEQFQHGLGHGLGLETHEPPYFNNLQTDVVLEPGIVMTVEPGVYLPGVGGVRIEDDIVVTDKGCRVLSSFRKNIDSAVVPVLRGLRQGNAT